MSYFPAETVRDAPLDNETVLMRADLNIPLEIAGDSANYRLAQAAPTIKHLAERGSRVVIASHLGRPKGPQDAAFSMQPVAERLSEVLESDVIFVPSVVGPEVSTAARRMSPGSIALLENLRFEPGEKNNDPRFAQALADDSRAKYFVQDGFGVAHRTTATTVAITDCLPSVGGLLLEREYEQIRGAVESPDRPLTVVMGGAKVSDKVGLVHRFIEQADRIIVAGAMATTFLRYKGVDVGQSRVETSIDDVLAEIYAAAAKKVDEQNVDEFLVLPEHVAIRTASDKSRQECPISAIPSDGAVLDMGSISVAKTLELVGDEGTIIWNGTLGVVEEPEFAEASIALARHVARKPGLKAIAGGGDTGSFVLGQAAYREGFSLVSTGGGASMALLSGAMLPAVEALKQQDRNV